MTSYPLYGPTRHIAHIDECYFYHVMEIPGHGVVGNEWDLRDGVVDYLGRVPFKVAAYSKLDPRTAFSPFTWSLEAPR
jgi:hypothetical protein